MAQPRLSRFYSEESCRKRLEYFLKTQRGGVAHFYENDQDPGTFNLSDASARASRLVRSVVDEKLLGDSLQVKELAKDLAVLALYDMAILIDDSESMSDEEDGQRIEILKGVLTTINDIYRHAAEPRTGVRAIRFINNSDDKDNFLGNPSELIKNHYFGGTTKIGTELHKRILKQLVLGEPMKKPLLIMVITDGAIEGEKQGLLQKVIINCVNKLDSKRPLGAHSVAFQFSCIGNDEGARRVLRELDDHAIVGSYVDCQKATQDLGPSDERPLTVTKLLLGAILDKYDEEGEDEDLEAIFAETEIDQNQGGDEKLEDIFAGIGIDENQNGQYQPAPLTQNHGAPYPQGNNWGIPDPQQANPAPGVFNPGHSQQHFQDNTSGYPGNPNPIQGPSQGQSHPGLGGGTQLTRSQEEIDMEEEELREEREEEEAGRWHVPGDLD